MTAAQQLGRAYEQKGRREGMQQGRREGETIGIQKGMQQGRQEGIQKGRQEIARNMLSNMHLDMQIVSQATGLSQVELMKLQEAGQRKQ